MSEPSPERSRTFSWDDPRIGAAAARQMSGRAYLEAMKRGELPGPPIMMALGIQIGEIDEGRVVFTFEPAEYHYNPIGSVHGGMLSTLCDSAMGCAIQSMLPAGVGYTTLELKVNFLRAITVETGTVHCEGRVLHVGGRVATAEARATDQNGRLLGHATTTCIVLRPGQ